jgi:hypothetical protein
MKNQKNQLKTVKTRNEKRRRKTTVDGLAHFARAAGVQHCCTQ